MENSDSKLIKEFGGSPGALILILWSHGLMYYLWICLEFFEGGLFVPSSAESVASFVLQYFSYIYNYAYPTAEAVVTFLSFFFLQVVLALLLPGPRVKGLPVPSEGNKAHTYKCNAVWCWYFTLSLLFVLNYTGVFRLSRVQEIHGPLMTVVIITSDAMSIGVYYAGIYLNKQTRMSQEFIYDFFMGSWLNPRIGDFDLKMWAEIRVSWMQLFILTLSAAFKQYESLGHLSRGMVLIVLAQYLYSNAVMKGEECVPTTWDIFYEKWGWMLIFWNIAGVPYVYSFQAQYILKNPEEFSPAYLGLLIAVLLAAYYVWDTSQSQKNRFRMALRGNYVPRKAFPQLPWGTLSKPKYLQTESGSLLLIDGWWKYARKIHYTADIIMSCIWGLSCGFKGLLPYFYPLFFLGMISHRYSRDTSRCIRKYGKDWTKYTSIVKYAFIPGLI
jgi:Delta24(24(1))-sterol reductase